MTDPKPNLDLLRRVLRQIDDHPETWEQACIAQKTDCGTACCISGHAAVMLGRNFSFSGDSDQAWKTTAGEDVWELTERELGLTEDEAESLFHFNNSRSDIQSVAEQIAARGGEVL